MWAEDVGGCTDTHTTRTDARLPFYFTGPVAEAVGVGIGDEERRKPTKRFCFVLVFVVEKGRDCFTV